MARSSLPVEQGRMKSQPQLQAPCAPDFPPNSLDFNCSILWSHQVCIQAQEAAGQPRNKATLLTAGTSWGWVRTLVFATKWKSQGQDTQSHFVCGNSLTAFSETCGPFFQTIFIQYPPPMLHEACKGIGNNMSSLRQTNTSSDSPEICFLRLHCKEPTLSQWVLVS